MKQKNRNTHTSNETPVAGSGSAAAPINPETETAHRVVNIRPAKGARSSIFDMDETPVGESVGHKLQVSQEARQTLAQAKDLWDASAGQSVEAEELSAKAALQLSTAAIAGEMSPQEVSGALGDVFGFKPKADGSTGTTPAGQGEAIRKRIVRLTAAKRFVDSGEAADGFFKGMVPDAQATIKLKDNRNVDVTPKDVIKMTFNGELGFWAAYEAFAAIKRSTQVPVPLAMNVKRIAEIAEYLQKDGIAEQFVKNGTLRQAYKSLWTIIRVVAEEAGELAQKAA